MQTIFFNNIAHLRQWFYENQERQAELWAGIYKKESGLQVMTRTELIDEALCFGWSESRVKRIDGSSYAVRLSPRKPGSKWSAKNLNKAQQFMDMGLMEESGKQAFLQRDKSYDNYDKKTEKLAPSYQKLLTENVDACLYFEQMSPSYKKHASRWIMQAKREETRQKRLQILIDCCERGEKIPLLA